MPTPLTKTCLHGSAVKEKGSVTLYLGQPGVGKTRAVIDAIERGGCLVADDYVCVEKAGKDIFVYAPANGRGLLEMRGSGIARLPYVKREKLTDIVCLDRESAARIPVWLNDCAILYSYPTLAA